MDFNYSKFWKPEEDRPTVIRLLGTPLNYRQYYIDPRRQVETFLDTNTFFDRYEVVGDVKTIEDRPDCVCEQCEKRRAAGLGPVQRYHLPVIDIETQKQLMISVPMTARRVLAELIEKVRRIEETTELIRLQQAAAARFKQSKMYYGAKR